MTNQISFYSTEENNSNSKDTLRSCNTNDLYKFANKILNVSKWIGSRLEMDISIENFLENLPKGEFLLKFANSLHGTAEIVYEDDIRSYRHIDNILNFIKWLKIINFPSQLIFDPYDLYESKDLCNVFRCLVYLSNFLCQKRMYSALPDEEVIEFSNFVLIEIEGIMKKGNKYSITSILHHRKDTCIDSDGIYFYNSNNACEFTIWDANCYLSLESLELKQTNDLEKNAFTISDLNKIYKTKNGKLKLKNILSKNIFNENFDSLDTVDKAIYLSKFKREIVKYEELIFAILEKYGDIPPHLYTGFSFPEHEVSFLVRNIIENDSSENYARSTQFFADVFIFSHNFEIIKKQILNILPFHPISLDPMELYRKTKNNFSSIKNIRIFTREQLMEYSLSNILISHEIERRMNAISLATHKIIYILKNAELPGYLKAFFSELNQKAGKNISDLSDLIFTKDSELFKIFIAPLLKVNSNSFIIKELLKTLIKNPNLFKNKILVESPRNNKIVYYDTGSYVSDVDMIVYSPLKEHLKYILNRPIYFNN